MVSPATLWLLSAPTMGQTSPSDLADASLAELLDMELEDWQGPGQGPRLRFGYHYVRSAFAGYRSGTTELADDAVLFEPATGELRTAENFPVLPTEIVQEAHVLDASYQLVDALALGVTLPIIRQSTDHVSVIEGYDAFTIASSGIGDPVVQGVGTLLATAHHALQLNLGISVPLGSIDEVGDTPRAPGDQQLPYTMQVGSGTWDLPLGLTWSGQSAGAIPLIGGLQGQGKLRSGRNRRGYRLGDRGMLAAWIGVQPVPWLEPSLKLSGVAWGRIVGEDTEITVPGAFAYPAPVTDPARFGGRTLVPSLGLAATIPGARGAWVHQRLELELGRPAYQDLHGPQPQERWRMSAGLRLGY